MTIGKMLMFARRAVAAAASVLVLTCSENAGATDQEPVWTIVLHPKDFLIGAALGRLKTRHRWVDRFDDQTGNFEVAVSRSAVAIPAPRCRMDYLILTIPFYYPENPKQASLGERRAIHDSLVALQGGAGGSVSMRVEAPSGLARMGAGRIELVGCNVYFALPLSVQFADTNSLEQRAQLNAEIGRLPVDLRARFDQRYRDWKVTWRPERGNLTSDDTGKGASGFNREAESTDVLGRGGRLVVALKRM